MCGSLLSKFQKKSNKVAPVLGAGYMETKRVSTKTNLAVETARVEDNMSLDEISLGQKTRTTVRFPYLARFIEVKPSKDTEASKEENTLSTSDESSRLEPVFGSNDECKLKAEAQSTDNGIITLTVEQTDDSVIEGRKITAMDLKKHKEKMVASQSDALSSSNARLSDEIMISTTVNKDSLTSVQNGRFSGCTVQHFTENVLEVTNQQELALIGDNETKLTAPHDDPQETVFVVKALPANGEENANAKKDKLSTSDENCKLDIVSVSDAECRSNAEATSKEMAVTTLTSVSPSWSTEKHHKEKMTVVSNDPCFSYDETIQGSPVAVQNGQFSGSRILPTIETVVEAVDQRALAPVDGDEETLTETAVVSKPLSPDIEDNMPANENTVSSSDENNKSEDVSGFDVECDSKAEVQSMEKGFDKAERQDGLDQSFSHIKVAWDAESPEDKMAAIYTDAHSNQASKKSLVSIQIRPFSDCTLRQTTETELTVEDQRTIAFINKHKEKLTVINGDLQESNVISKPLSADGQGLTEINFKQTKEMMNAPHSDLQQSHLVSKPLSANVHGLAELNFKQTKEKMNALSGSPSFILSAKRSAKTILPGAQKLATIDASEEKLTVVKVDSGSIHVEEAPVTPKPSFAIPNDWSHDDVASQSTTQSPDNPYQHINGEELLAMATRELESKVFSMTLRSSAKNRKLLLAVAKKELEKKIMQMTDVHGGVTFIATTRSPAYPKRKATCSKNKETSLAMAKKQFAETLKERIAVLQSGHSSSNTVRSILLGKTKNTIAFEVVDRNKGKQTVIPSARLPLSLRKLDDPQPVLSTTEVLKAKLFHAQEHRLRELEQVRSRARSMAWSPNKTYRQ